MPTDRSGRSIPILQTIHIRREMLILIVISAVVFSFTSLLVLVGTTIGLSVVLGAIVAAIIAAVIARWPIVGFYVVAGCVVLIEQVSLLASDGTDNLYVYSWPTALQGLIERPIGFLFIFIFVAMACHHLHKRQPAVKGGQLLLPYLFFLLCVAGGIVHGLMTGGDLKMVVVEVRPFWYLFVSYILAYNLATSLKHIRAFFWIVILGAGIKTLQGLYLFLIVLHGNLDIQHQIMSHEESFFFVALILLVMLFYLHHRYRPQYYAALFILPGLIIVLIANQRRADYLALLIGMLVAWALIFCIKPRARKALLFGLLVCLVLGVGYVAAFSQSTGILGAPAHGLVSIFSTDPTNSADSVAADSNLYRSNEDYDLKYTALQNPLFGLGFGKQFLQPIVLVNILSLDPVYLYVPHNTIYWVWMRLGALGFLALWYLLGAIIVRGCLIARQLRTPYLQVVAIYIVVVTFMEIIVAFADYQLYVYRNVIYLGLLAGILMKLPDLDEKRGLPTHESTRSLSLSPLSVVGSGNSQLLSTKSAGR